MSEWLSRIDWLYWKDNLHQWSLKLMAAMLILFIGLWVSRSVSRLFSAFLRGRGYDYLMTAFVGHVVYTALAAAVIIAALDSIGVDTTSLLAIVGAAGLAVGLALKDSLGNLASGVMIVGLRHFREGDFVEVVGTSGTVAQVRLFHTTLHTADNRKVIVPNGQITRNTITNYTAMDTRRLDLTIGINYQDDLQVAESVMLKVLNDHPRVLAEPAAKVLLVKLAEYRVVYELRPWVKNEDVAQVRSELLTQVKQGLQAAGCSLALPVAALVGADSKKYSG